jgi:DNA mismatch repair protein MutS2
MQRVIQQEQHKQEVERLQHQNKISEEKLVYLKDMERRLKAMVIEWRRAEDKETIVRTIQSLLFNQKEKMQGDRKQKKLDEKFREVGGELKVGDKVKMKNNRTIGIVKELRGKKAILQVGVIPITVEAKDLVVVVVKTQSEQ